MTDDYHYDKLAYEKRYSIVYGEGVRFWEKPIPTEELIEFIEERSYPPNVRAIDLGCGEGRDSIYLAKRGFDVTAVDISCSAIKRAKERANEEDAYINFIIGDVVHLEFIRDGTYELAIDVGCLHIIVDPEARKNYLRNVFRILKRGGIYFSCNMSEEQDVKFEDVFKKSPKPGELIPRKVRTANGREKLIMLPVIAAWPKSGRQYGEELTDVNFKILRMSLRRTRSLGKCWVILAQKP